MKNKSERAQPIEGELWGRNRHPVMVVLRPKRSGRYLLATINVNPGREPMTRAELNDYLKGFKKVGSFSSSLPTEMNNGVPTAQLMVNTAKKI